MKKIFLFCLISMFVASCTLHIDKEPIQDPLRKEATALLKEWMDSLLMYQSNHPDPLLNGGIVCPACARIHGRIGDAVLPLMYLADETKEEKYLTAAKRLMKWMENVHRPDGSWMNDVNVSNWNGTSVFAAIALYEALHYHSHLLDDSTRNHWKEQLAQAGEFIMNNPFIYSRNRKGMRNMNVNYSASATYALYAIGTMCNRPAYLQEARVIAKDLLPYFTPNNSFLFGEGPNIWTETPNGCRPVDLLYNVEESLPNMLYYAKMAQDTLLEQKIEESMNTHLEFMLPDGAWDNSWGTRSFKWTYWGGRTSDGFMGGYYALGERHPEYLEAIYRNVQLMKAATHHGLLYAGSHYEEANVPPCIHHTFGHAKALTSFLELNEIPFVKGRVIPRDSVYGQKFMKDIRTWLVSQGEWRATITGYDAEYKVKGTHPMGGVLSLLWHAKTGPLFAATMNQYKMIEAPNMQMPVNRKYLTCGTPRIEMMHNGVTYTNLDDLQTTIVSSNDSNNQQFIVHTHLVDINQLSPEKEPVKALLKYNIKNDEVLIEAQVPSEAAYLMLPVIASNREKVVKNHHLIQIDKDRAKVKIVCETGKMSVGDTDADGRIFNPVPGFSFLPIKIEGDSTHNIKMRLIVFE